MKTIVRVTILTLLCVLSVGAQEPQTPTVSSQDTLILTTYYLRTIDSTNGFWRHSLGFAAEYEFKPRWTIGPRLTLAHKDAGIWYGEDRLLGIHLSRHFHVSRLLMPHVHTELGWFDENLIAQHTSRSSLYAGIGGSLGWRVSEIMTFQVPQYTYVRVPAFHRSLHLVSAGLSFHF